LYTGTCDFVYSRLETFMLAEAGAAGFKKKATFFNSPESWTIGTSRP
jgi:hypothetical protein